MEFKDYARNSLKQPPSQDYVGRWRINYLAFKGPEGCTRLPLVMLGGAFQNFNSFKYCLEHLLQVAPVVMVDLPSLGENDQLSSELGMEDLADLLHQWVIKTGLNKVSLMGLSLGSVIASTFAYKYPESTEKLLVTGILTRPRKSWRMLLEESLRTLDEGRLDEFGQAVVLYLVNHARLPETEITDTTRRLFHRQMRSFGANDQERYRINARRLLEVESILGYPSCPVLVATGEYDNFTMPFENANFAARCPNATFALIKDADHVAQLERRDTSMSMFAGFLRGDDMREHTGLRVYDPGTYLKLEHRGEPRFVPCNPRARVISVSPVDGSIAIDIPVNVHDMNFFGCLLTYEEQGFSLAEHSRDLILCLEGSPLRIELLVFEHGENSMRCLFKHGSFETAYELKALLDDEIFFRQRHNKHAHESSAEVLRIYRAS
ncbi:MAG: alpha/beta hydrolase [Pseudomonadales bacterium]|nr:alpha/beta hydrolase [Pseudomonadales bacterium]